MLLAQGVAICCPIILERNVTVDIFVLEDSMVQRKNIEYVLQTHIQSKNLNASISLSTNSPVHFLEAVSKSDKARSFYIFDIELQHTSLNGIDVATLVRQHDPFGTIVFVTSHEELSFLTFRHKIKAQDFIIKGDMDNIPRRLQESLDEAYKNFATPAPKEETFQIKHGSGVIENVDISNIMFFETHHTPHKLILHATNGRIEFYGTLDRLEEVNPAFFRSHRVNVININNVQSIDKTHKVAKMINGENALVSARKMSKLLEMLKQ